MKIAVPHQFSEDVARQRVELGLNDLRAKHSDNISDVKVNWQGNNAILSFVLIKPIRLPISANLAVKPAEVVLEGALPAIAWLFQDKIESFIREYLQNCLK